MQRRRVIGYLGHGLGLSALGGWTQGAWAQAAGVSDNRILLGQSAPFSGPAEQAGVQYYLGAQLYFEALNAKGGVNGRRIEIHKLDDAQNPERCVANTRQFISEGVFALFGYVGTDGTLAALPSALEARLPVFAPLSGATELREPFNRNLVHLRASYAEETAALVSHARSVGIQRFAVFYQNDAHGRSGLNGVVAALKAQGQTPVATAPIERDATDVTAAVAAILANRPEVIVQIGNYKVCASFIRQARQKGFTGNFYNVSTVGTQALMDELGAVAKGVVVSQVMPYPYSPTNALARDYIDAHKDKRGIVPNYVGMEGYVAARTFAEATRRAGRALTTESFLGAIDAMRDFDLGGLRLEFAPDRRIGSRFVEITILTSDGRVRK